MVLIIDNYDSFVFNIARYIQQLGYTSQVFRNDEITISDILTLKPSHIIISPGPCSPNEAGISLEVIRTFGENIPVLGICLGHQAIGQIYGAKILRARQPMHGKPSKINHNSRGIFSDIPSSLTVGRYHSLIVDENELSAEIIITARCELGEVMALEHRTLPIWGVQFHPESILTEHGYTMFKNFLALVPQ